MQMASDDPGYGASLATRLTQASTADGSDTAMLREFLHAAAGHLQEELAARPGVRAAACEHARAWAGPGLAAKLRTERSCHQRMTLRLTLRFLLWPSRSSKGSQHDRALRPALTARLARYTLYFVGLLFGIGIGTTTEVLLLAATTTRRSRDWAGSGARG